MKPQNIAAFLVWLIWTSWAVANPSLQDWSLSQIQKSIQDELSSVEKGKLDGIVNELIGDSRGSLSPILGQLPNELAEDPAVQKFGQLLHDLYGYQLLFTPRFRGSDIPAFDGVILSKENLVVANFSFKTATSRNEWQFYRRIEKELNRIAKYSKSEGWAGRLFKYTARFKPGSNHLLPITFQSSSQYKEFIDNLEIFKSLSALFGVETKRPNWILYSVGNQPLISASQVARLAKLTGPTTLIEKIFVLGSFSKGRRSETLMALADGEAQTAAPFTKCDELVSSLTD